MLLLIFFSLSISAMKILLTNFFVISKRHHIDIMCVDPTCDWRRIDAYDINMMSFWCQLAIWLVVHNLAAEYYVIIISALILFYRLIFIQLWEFLTLVILNFVFIPKYPLLNIDSPNLRRWLTPINSWMHIRLHITNLDRVAFINICSLFLFY